MSMNPEIKAEWTAALRSGEYEQGRGFLNKDYKLCCLGVLCELAVKAGVPVGVEEENHGMDGLVYKIYGGDSSYPPPSVVEWAGLPSKNPIVSDPPRELCPCGREGCYVESKGAKTLAGQNDNGDTFGQIADLIDQYL